MDISIDFFADELHIFLQIVRECRHQNMFVRVLYSSCIHPLHVVVIDKRAQNGFNTGTSAFGEETGVVRIALEFLVHFIVKRFVDGIINLFKFGHFSAAFCSKWTVFAIPFTATVDFLCVAFGISFGVFIQKKSSVTTRFCAFITVFFSIKNKTFPKRFALSEVWDIGIQVVILTILLTIATTITCIG